MNINLSTVFKKNCTDSDIKFLTFKILILLFHELAHMIRFYLGAKKDSRKQSPPVPFIDRSFSEKGEIGETLEFLISGVNFLKYYLSEILIFD